MRYQLTYENRPILADVLRLIQETRRLLAFADASVNAEWDNMRSRFPSNEDLRQGFISLSRADLENVRLQLLSFRVQVSRHPELPEGFPELPNVPLPAAEIPSMRRSSSTMPVVAQPAMLA